MSFFDSVKKSLGMSKDKQAPAAGTVGRSSTTYDQFEFTFVEEKLGIGISKYTGVMPHLDAASSTKEERSCPVVTNFDSRKYDIQPGDLIVALEGNPISSFDDFTTIVKAIGRPVRIRFLRRNHRDASGGGAGTTAHVTADKSSNNTGGTSLSGGMGNMNIFRNLGVGSVAKPAAPIAVLSEEEKALRRERLSAAAQDRSKSWDKKLGQKKSSQSLHTPIVDAGSGEPAGETHADTERAIRKTKELEVRIEQQMGYSPFRPHMSFSSGAAAGSSASASASSASVGGGGSARPLSVVPEQGEPGAEEGGGEEAEELWVAEVDDAFAMLLSLGESDQEVGKVAVVTVSRMIQNLAAAPEDQKLRSIRVSNKAFQSKVAGVPGGAELLVAAGYEYQTCASGAATAAGAAGAAAEEEEELFLVHSMLPDGRGKLRYTLSRIQELLVSVSGAASPAGNSSPRQT